MMRFLRALALFVLLALVVMMILSRIAFQTVRYRARRPLGVLEWLRVAVFQR